MDSLHFVLFFSIFLLAENAVWNLNGMTQCKLRIPATYYNDYGCYCGLGGAGTPVDGIDQCCMAHDNCYGKAMDTLGCPDIYTLPYSYTCSNHEPICNENQDACKNALCECDQAIVQCWLQYPVPEDKATCTSQKNPLESNKIS